MVQNGKIIKKCQNGLILKGFKMVRKIQNIFSQDFVKNCPTSPNSSKTVSQNDSS